MSDETYGNPQGHGIPEDYPKYIIDQKWKDFTPENHAVWKILFNRQRELMKNRACREWIKGLDNLGIDDSQIPNFVELSESLKKKTGWTVVAVPGLIPNQPFFKMLSERIFPAGNFIRERSSLDYIESPDVFHDVFGHVPLLSDPVFADYLEAFGHGGLRAFKHDMLDEISRLYWFTVEFGLVQQDDGLRIYGAGIMSSIGETQFSLESPSPNRIGFDLERTMRTRYRVDDYQQTYVVVPSLEELLRQTLDVDFLPIYEKIKSNPKEYGLSELAPGDKIITRGTQEYAKAKDAKKSA